MLYDRSLFTQLLAVFHRVGALRGRPAAALGRVILAGTWEFWEFLVL